MLDALQNAKPLLCSMFDRRPCRSVVRRAILGRTQTEARRRGGGGSGDRTLDREEHRVAALLCPGADAVRPSVSGGRCRAYRAADRRQGLNLAVSDVHYLSEALREFYDEKSEAGLDAYSANALARVWKAERFSWWMTSMLHLFPDIDDFS